MILPKAGTAADAVAQAKTAATDKGAPDVGALDSDAYPSLSAGSYVLYSGVFTAKKAATAALSPLAANFPDARVVRVAATATAAATSGAAKSKAARSSASPAKTAAAKKKSAAETAKAFEKSKKAPKTVGTGGKPPPKDSKPAASGGGFQSIG